MTSIVSSSRPRRVVSTVLSELPWYTTVISDSLNLDSLGENLPSLKSFLRRLESYDKLLFSIGNATYDKQEMLRLLGVELCISASNAQLLPALEFTYTNNWTAVQASRMCALFSAYRLVDVACLVEGLEGVEAGPMVCREVASLVKFKTLPAVEDLFNWPSVLLAARDGFAKSTLSYSTDVSFTCSAPSRLVQWLSMSNAKSKVSKVECNLLVAAIHLASLTKVLDGVLLPDIPDNMDDLVKLLCSPESPTVDATAQANRNASFLRGYCEECRPKGRNSTDLSHLRSPLLLALWISPLCLFAPVLLSKKIFHKQNLINTATGYGNRKPALLLSIEKTIWKALFNLSNGLCDPASTIMKIIQIVPWSEVEALSATDDTRSWFDPNTIAGQYTSVPAPHSSASSSIANQIVNVAGLQLPSPIPSSLVPPGTGVASLSTVTQAEDVASIPDGPGPLPYPTTAVVAADSDDGSGNQHQQDSPPPTASCCGDSAEGTNADADASMADGTVRSAHSTIGKRVGSAATASSPVAEDPVDGIQSDGAGDEPPPPPKTLPTRASSRIASKVAPVDPPFDEVAFKKRPPKRKRSVPKSSAVYEDSESDGDNPDIPIDVDAFAAGREPVASKQYYLKLEEEFIDVTMPPSRLVCERTNYAYDASGLRHKFSPSFHNADYYPRVQSFFDRVEASYVDGKPLHLSNPSESTITLVDYTTYCGMSVGDVFKILRSKNIVVTGYPTPTTQFDKTALRRLHNLTSPVSIQDYSFGPIGGTPSATKTVSGTVNHLLESAAAGVQGKILNALEFPASRVPPGTPAFLTDLLAWDSTRGSHNMLLNSVYPAGDMFWGLAGTADTVTFAHIDSDGLATGIQVMCGSKIWGLYKERDGSKMSTISPLLAETFCLDQVTEQSDFDMEAIVLRPGDLLIMRPNTPHFVFGLHNTICHGFHFYTAATMQATLCGIIHTFVLSDFITNISHPPTRHILRRLLIFFFDALFQHPFQPDGTPFPSRSLAIIDASADPEYEHIPDLSNVPGILDLLSLCNLVILGNVLDFRTYSAPNQSEHRPITDLQAFTMDRYDQNDIPWDERMSACYARGIAITILRLVQKHVLIKGDGNDAVEGLPGRLIAGQMKALLSYKLRAENDALEGAPHCTADLLKVQLDNVLAWAPEIHDAYEGAVEALDFGSTEGLTGHWTLAYLSAIDVKGHNFLALGTTPLDKKFFSFKSNEERPAKRIRS